MPDPLHTVTTFIRLSEALETDPAVYQELLHPDVEQIEYPNLRNRSLQRRSFSEIIEHIRAGRELLLDPHIELRRTQTCADGSILVEAYWHATLATDIGSMIRGQRLSTYFCLVFELKEGKIIQQRTYGCFDHF